MRTAFVVFLALLPLIPAANIGTWDISLVRVFALLFVFAALGAALAAKRIPLPKAPGFWALFFFAVFALASVLWAEAAQFALRKGIFLVGLAPIAWLVFYFRKDIKPMLKALVAAGCMASFLGLVQVAAGWLFSGDAVIRAVGAFAPRLWGAETAQAVLLFPSFYVDLGGPLLRAFFPFPDPHTFALFVGISFFVTLGFFLETKKRALFGALALLQFCAILLSFSRGGYLALFVGAIFFALLLGRRALPFTVSVIVIVIVIVMAFAPVRDRALAMFDFSEGSIAARLALWENTATIFTQAPFFGVGLGGLAHAFSPGASFRVPTNAHNTYLEIAAELGVMGFFFFVTALAFSLFSLTRAFRRTGEQWLAGVAAALAVYAAHSFFETTLYSPQVFVAFAVLIGIAAVPSGKIADQTRIFTSRIFAKRIRD